MTADTAKLLRIYLNDHFLAASAGVALARRIAGANQDTPFGAPLSSLADEVAGDLSTLTSMMKRVDVTPQRWRAPAGALTEKAGRLKLNGHVLSRSPLSSVVELEALLAGIEAKRAMWRTLRRLADSDDRLDAAPLDDLIERSWRQSDAVEPVRAWAIAAAFTATEAPHS
jgi:hypothetical protein